MAVHLITIGNGRDTVQFRDEHSTRTVGEWFVIEYGEHTEVWQDDAPTKDIQDVVEQIPAFAEHTPVYVRVEAEVTE